MQGNYAKLFRFSSTSKCFQAKSIFLQINLSLIQKQNISIQLKMNYSSKQVNEVRRFLCCQLDNRRDQFINVASFEMDLLTWLLQSQETMIQLVKFLHSFLIFGIFSQISVKKLESLKQVMLYF